VPYALIKIFSPSGGIRMVWGYVLKKMERAKEQAGCL
jgi:hypothetical protein